MRFKTKEFDVEVKMKPTGNEVLIREPVIQLRAADGKIVQKVRVVAKNRFVWQGKDLAVDIKLTDPQTKKEVPISEALEILDHFNYKNLSEDGSVIGEAELLYYDVQEDGTEKPCSPYEGTKVLDLTDEENWVPYDATDGFLITEVYEIYAPEEDKKACLALFEEAEKRWKAEQACIVPFSHGRGFKAYYAFICPLFKDGRWVWLLKKTDKKIAYNHLEDPPTATKVPIREAPTLQTLPPVALLVAVAKKKKQA